MGSLTSGDAVPQKPALPDTGCADKLKILADPTRLSVLELLLAGPRHVGEINEVLQIDQSLLSHHLRVLRDAGLVLAERDGKAVLYSLAPAVGKSPDGTALNLNCCVLSFPRRADGR
jgi:ArsR family transcriptional regulator